MKKLLGLVAVAALALTVGISVRAETIKVFALDVGQVTSNSTFQDPISGMLNDETKDVDFGYFYGMKSTTYFKTTDANYTIDNQLIAAGYGGIHAFTYRTDRYSYLKRYEKTSVTSGAIDACVVSNKVSHRIYALVMPTSVSFNKADSLSAVGPVITKCLEDYPLARVFVGTANAYGDSYLKDYLLGLDYNLVEFRPIDDAMSGAFYVTPDTAIDGKSSSVVSVSGVSSPEKGKPAVVATVVYSATTHHVVFKKGDVVLDEQDVEDGASAVAPEMPEVDAETGFVFRGWDPVDFSKVTNDMTISANYVDPATLWFTVRFLDKDGEEIVDATQSVMWGLDAVAPVPPAVEDFVFVKWMDEFTAVKSDIVVRSKYRPECISVSTAAEFVEGVGEFGAEGAKFVLVNDIDFTGVTFDSNDLAGEFDGNGHVMSNLTGNIALFKIVTGSVKNLRLANFDREFESYNTRGALLANRLEGATVSGVEIDNCSIGANNSGCGLSIITYYATSNGLGEASVITNCVVNNCKLTGIDNNIIGGFVGELDGGSEVVDCRFLTDDAVGVSIGGDAAAEVGGIVAESNGGCIRRCYANGCFKAGSTGSQQKAGVGGIVGFVSGKRTDVIDCTNAASVIFSNYNGGAGGVVGRGQKSTLCISGCVNEGAVTVSTSNPANTSYVGCGAGGIFGGSWGANTVTTIVDCKNLGIVVSEDTRAAGGILGEDNGTAASGTVSCRFTNCVNVASVSSLKCAGGVAGRLFRLQDNFALVNCGSAGTVSCPTGNVGGVIGEIVGIPQNNDKNYYYKDIYNIMNCGTLSTESGTVGKFVGVLEGSERNAYQAQVKSGFFVDRENTDIVGFVSGKDGTGVTVDESSDVNLAASKFTDGTVVDLLNVYAAANRLSKWVQKEYYPDLAQGVVPEPTKGGLILLFR